MTRVNIVHKEEKRFSYCDPEGPPGQNTVFMVAEQKLDVPNPKIGPCMFQLALGAQMVTRKQLEGIRDCISDALDSIPEGRIVTLPPGSRISS